MTALSERERETLQLYFNGMPREKIAKKLNMAVSTVGVHLFNTKAKLGVRSNVELVRWCEKNLEATKS